MCGIRPYHATHLGHAFTYLSFDALIRYLEYLGYQVRYIQSVTDIDDAIFGKAKMSKDWRALGNCWTPHFVEDMRSLNVRPPARLCAVAGPETRRTGREEPLGKKAAWLAHRVLHDGKYLSGRGHRHSWWRR